MLPPSCLLGCGAASTVTRYTSPTVVSISIMDPSVKGGAVHSSCPPGRSARCGTVVGVGGAGSPALDSTRATQRPLPTPLCACCVGPPLRYVAVSVGSVVKVLEVGAVCCGGCCFLHLCCCRLCGLSGCFCFGSLLFLMPLDSVEHLEARGLYDWASIPPSLADAPAAVRLAEWLWCLWLWCLGGSVFPAAIVGSGVPGSSHCFVLAHGRRPLASVPPTLHCPQEAPT